MCIGMYTSICNHVWVTLIHVTMYGYMHRNIYTYIYIYIEREREISMNIYIYIYIYIYICTGIFFRTRIRKGIFKKSEQ